ncbi:unnamed protein product [Rotaria sordida]|uniref:Uncharacterized protein n=1 Tax=Rotaria sordida TaxID=392033 RepID=A0A814A295_9BILA|nr:unnamed protein product [Rotaria sordida]
MDNTNRQSSRTTSNVDAIDCMVNTNDLALENEVVNKERERQRGSSSSRRDPTSKRSNESLVHRSSRHSPPSATRKRHSSPRSASSVSLSSRSHHHHYQPQRYHRVSSPSPSPPPTQSSTRHHRPVTAIKRSHSKSRSPYERRPPTHRSRRETSKERTINDVLKSISSTDEQTLSKQITLNQETTDLSFVSEDELTKPHDIRSNSTVTHESSSVTTNNKLHSTPSVPVLEPKPNESLLEMSNIPQECELSLFAKSSISTTNTNSILTTSIRPTNDFVQTIDLISKYKKMQAEPCSNPQIEACSKEILILIQKQIELQKIELNYREREIKLRERELAEREKRFNEKLNDTTSMTSVNSEPLVVIKSTIIEEKSQQGTDIIIDQDMKDVSEEESIVKSIPSTIDTSKVNLSNKNNSEQPSLIRKKNGKSRFSPIIVDPSILTSQQNSTIDLHSDDHDNNQLSSSINTNNSSKKPTISKILAPNESIKSIGDADIKVTSSNSCRKVEFQSGPIDKTSTNKGSSHDLRLTLSKNRTKHNNDHDDNGTNGSQITNDDDSTITNNKPMSSKINPNKEDKQQSHDYQQQRSVTSTSIETTIDDIMDKRDTRRHQQQRINSSRQQQNSSSSTNNLKERSYTYESTSQQPAKYGSNQKRHEMDDLRSRLFEQKNSKSSRTTHRNNY